MKRGTCLLSALNKVLGTQNMLNKYLLKEKKEEQKEGNETLRAFNWNELLLK